jgi:hypothetical protein
MTLPELLVSVVVLGLLAVAITGAVTASLAAEPVISDRLDTSRAEQSLALWMPADLSSAVSSDERPSASPCDGCSTITALGGSNALMLSWPDGGATTHVSYVYRPSDGSDRYELVRAACTGSSCETATMLRGLEGPPHDQFVPGATPVPTDVFRVSIPLGADAESEADTTDPTATAHRIIVSVNGGRSADSTSRISITAGGTTLGALDPARVTGPSFLAARSRCGGPITLIVDESGSIAPYASQVRDAVADFVDTLAGTPTSVQVVRFDSWSDVMSPEPNAWNHYFQMSDPAQVAELERHVSGIRGDWAQATGNPNRGGTNWEDALFRTFYDRTGRPLNDDGDPTTVLPNLVVFFTDGAPTFDRLSAAHRSDGAVLPASPPPPSSAWPRSTGVQFGQVAWDRAEFIAARFRSIVRIVGVGVGGISNQSFSFTDPQEGIRYNGSLVEGYRPASTWRGTSWAWRYLGNGRDPSATWSGQPTVEFTAGLVDNSKLLGNLVVGGVPTVARDAQWVESELVNGTWTNTDEADLLISPTWSALADALASIAVGQCGGSLTLRTELPDGSPADLNATYETGGETVTTSRIARAAAFDLDIPTGGATTVTVTPQSFDPAYTATGWSCSKRGAPMSTGWSLVDPTAPAAGVVVTVGANEAVSCAMTVQR